MITLESEGRAEDSVYRMVASSGYGPWYQRQAWLRIKDWEIDNLIWLGCYYLLYLERQPD